YTAAAPPKHVAIGQFRVPLIGATPFFIAAISADVPWMQFLIANGADPSIPTASNVTPLLAAAGLGYWDGETPGSNEEALAAVKFAFDLGNDPKHVVHGDAKPVVAWEGTTAMHGAAIRGSRALVDWLVAHGVPLDDHSSEGISAYHIVAGLAGI